MSEAKRSSSQEQLRTFKDRTGVVWTVSEVAADTLAADEARERRARTRSVGRSSSKKKLLTTRPHAWLCFESKSERRGLSSVPNGWNDLDDEALEDLMGQSQPV